MKPQRIGIILIMLMLGLCVYYGLRTALTYEALKGVDTHILYNILNDVGSGYMKLTVLYGIMGLFMYIIHYLNND